MARRGPHPLLLIGGAVLVAGLAFATFMLLSAEPETADPASAVKAVVPPAEAPAELDLDIAPPPTREVEDEPTPGIEPGSITGRIRTTDLRVVAVAEVELRQGTPLDLGQVQKLRRLGSFRTDVAADGSFRFEGVPAHDQVVVRVTGEDFATTDVGPYSIRAGEETDVGDIVVEPGVELRGWVYGPDGEAVGGARVALYTGWIQATPAAAQPEPERIVLTDDQGIYRFPNALRGSFTLEVLAEGYGTAMVERRVGISPDEKLLELPIELRKALVLSGRVVDAESGKRIAGASVVAVCSGKKKSRSVTETDQDGVFRFVDLTRGRFQISAGAKGYSIAATVLNPRVHEGELVLRLPPAGSIRGTVSAPDGAVIRYFDLLVRRSSKDSIYGVPAGGSQRFRTRDGRFEIVDLTPGWYSFEVWSKGYAVSHSEPVQLLQGQHLDGIVVTMEPGGELFGRVVNDLGAPIGSAVVSLHSNRLVNVDFLRATEEKQSWLKSTRTDGEGLFVLSELTPGAYQVQIDHPSYPVELRNDVVVGRGDSIDLGTFELPRPATIQGFAVDRNGQYVSRATVYVGGGSVTSRQTKTDGNGAYSFDRLAPGRYRVQAVTDRPDPRDLFRAELSRVLALKRQATDGDGNVSIEALQRLGTDLEVQPGEVRSHNVVVDG